jgi:hypothetical protein
MKIRPDIDVRKFPGPLLNRDELPSKATKVVSRAGYGECHDG